MTNVAEIASWLNSLKTSAPFAIALPFVVSTVLATLAWRFERSVAAARHAAQDKEPRAFGQDAVDAAKHR